MASFVNRNPGWTYEPADPGSREPSYVTSPSEITLSAYVCFCLLEELSDSVEVPEKHNSYVYHIDDGHGAALATHWLNKKEPLKVYVGPSEGRAWFHLAYQVVTKKKDATVLLILDPTANSKA